MGYKCVILTLFQRPFHNRHTQRVGVTAAGKKKKKKYGCGRGTRAAERKSRVFVTLVAAWKGHGTVAAMGPRPFSFGTRSHNRRPTDEEVITGNDRRRGPIGPVKTRAERFPADRTRRV